MDHTTTPPVSENSDKTPTPPVAIVMPDNDWRQIHETVGEFHPEGPEHETEYFDKLEAIIETMNGALQQTVREAALGDVRLLDLRFRLHRPADFPKSTDPVSLQIKALGRYMPPEDTTAPRKAVPEVKSVSADEADKSRIFTPKKAPPTPVRGIVNPDGSFREFRPDGEGAA